MCFVLNHVTTATTDDDPAHPYTPHAATSKQLSTSSSLHPHNAINCAAAQLNGCNGGTAGGGGGGDSGGVTVNVSPTITFWYRLNRLVIRLCSTHQFKNLQVSRTTAICGKLNGAAKYTAKTIILLCCAQNE